MSMPPKRIKIAMNAGGASAAAVARESLDSIPGAKETGRSSKRVLEYEGIKRGRESLNGKRSKQESQLNVNVMAEPKSREDDASQMVNIFLAPQREREQPWRAKATELLDFMDLQDKSNLYRTHASEEAGVALVRARVGHGMYDSFEDFVTSLRLVYESSEQYVGTDLRQQSLKLLERLNCKIKVLNDSSAALRSHPISDQLACGADHSGSAASVDDDERMFLNTREEMQSEIDYFRDGASEDEDDRELPRRSVCSTFEDKYEYHSDHDHRPFFVCLMVRKEFDGQNNKRQELETHVFFEFYKIQSKEKVREAENFILSIAEPVNRPSFIHEYKLTATSLYAAVTIGKSTEDIINELARQAKNVLPSETVNFIEKHTQNIGKLELIDSGSDNLTLIVYDHHIAEKMCGNGDLGCRLFDLGLRRLDSDAFYGEDTGSNSEAWKREFDEDSIMRSHQGIARRFILQSSQNCTQICKVLLESTYSVTNLYDFKSDASVKRVEMNPRSKASLRPYQEECLSKIFGNGRARSGIIVLPCGAGKTLVGVSVASLIQRDTLVLCSSSVAVRQWAEQFQMWTTVKKECVIEFTADIALDEARMHFGVIVITTYSMMRRGITTGKQEANVGAQKLVKHNWGLLILDEVHMAASKGTEEVLRHMTKVRCKVGLTATLVREDAKVQLLDILVGPKLYEAKWMALAENGYIARVRCIEILCPMTSEFYRCYLETTDFRAKMRLWTLNPNKYLACLHVLKLHQVRQDKVLIFIDDRVTLHSYGDQLVAQGFSVKTMHGGTPEKEKNEMIKCFKCTQGFAVLLLSRVGDVAIDLPEASVLIEVDGHFGSRRQEAQRLGRILRAKTNAEGSFNASFYVLVSKDTGDTYFAPKRQAYLVDQGYAYNSVCMHGPGEETMWGDDAGINIKFVQKLENFHNEKQDYQEKIKKDREEEKYKNQRYKRQNKLLNMMCGR